MGYASLEYYYLVMIVLVLYMIIPSKRRYIALLMGSIAFYCFAMKDVRQLAVLLWTAVYVYGAGIVLHRTGQKDKGRNKLLFIISLIICLIPFLLIKTDEYAVSFGMKSMEFIRPLGLSFYSLQMAAYLSDIYSQKIVPQKNIAKYLLFMTWFPQIIQGPIPRYDRLGEQLWSGKRADAFEFRQGIRLITFGLFLKFIIADKAAVFVNAVFASPDTAGGSTVLAAGILYSIQLYTDFYACSVLAKGVSLLFGIWIEDNFRRPYLAVSVQDFWRRWHISLSEWLRDYIYIPLGGSRKGISRKYLNIMITFLVSGFWHGGSIAFIFWGLMHGVYQIVGNLTGGKRDLLLEKLGIGKHIKIVRVFRTAATFFFVMLAWIIFRADSLLKGLHLIAMIFTDAGISGETLSMLAEAGVKMNDLAVMLAGIVILAALSIKQEKGSVTKAFLALPGVIRWTVYIAAFTFVLLMGTYGGAYKAADFIYGQF